MKTSLFLIAAVSMQIASAQYYTYEEEPNLRGLAADAVAKSASTKAEKSTASAKAEKV